MSRAPFIFDFVALFLILAVPAILWGVSLARKKKDYKRHRSVQLSLTVMLLVLVGVFEVSLSTIDWREAATLSPFSGPNLEGFLRMHLFAAVSALILWILVPVLALWNFGFHVRQVRSGQAGSHAQVHRILGRLTVIATLSAAVSGWIFYYLAFVAV